MAHFMPGYNMSLKPEADTIPMNIPMSYSQQIPSQAHASDMDLEAMSMGIDVNAMSTSSMSQNTMAFSNDALNVGTMSFTNPYNLATAFPANLPTMDQLNQANNWSNYGQILPMAPMESTQMRSNSLSSSESYHPHIKSEEQFSDMQPSQLFYNAPVYTSQSESCSPTSSEDSKSIDFSTDVDTLMKAIQMKTGQPPQPQEKVSSPCTPELRRGTRSHIFLVTILKPH